MQKPFSAVLLSVFVCLSLPDASFGDAPEFRALGFASLASLTSARAVSADGSVVVGLSVGPSPEWENEAVEWSSNGKALGLGFLPSGLWSQANAISANGQVIGGIADSQAFRWTSATGMVALGYLPDNAEESSVEAVSADGQYLAGYSRSEHSLSTHQAFRWSAESGMQSLGVLPGESWSTAIGISADGSKVVGSSGNRPFLWEATRGMQPLGSLDPSLPYGEATAISAGGEVVAGYSGTQMFIWTKEKGMLPLSGGNLSCESVEATPPAAVSASGQIIVGGTYVWTPSTGFTALETYLAERGVGFPGWTLTEVTSVSADGMTFVGNGVGPDQLERAWMAKTAPLEEVCFDLSVRRTTRTSVGLVWKSTRPPAGSTYELQVATTPEGPWRTLTRVRSVSSSFSHVRLAPGTTYFYRIQRIDRDQLASHVKRAKTVAPPAGSLFITSAYPVSPGSIRLEWSDTSFEQTYKVQRRGPEAPWWVQVGELSEDQTVFVDQTIEGKNPGQIYSYQIIASGPKRRTAKSNTVSVTAMSLTAPLRPVLRSAKAISLESVKISWLDGADESGYSVERRISNSAVWTQVGQAGTNATQFIDNGVGLNTTYDYRVSALNSQGTSSPSNIKSARTPKGPPPPPSEIDSSFNSGAFSSTIRCIVEQTDGKLLVGGDFKSSSGALVRLNENGIVDTTFGAKLGAGPNFSVYEAAIQTDGKIVIVGQFTKVNQTDRKYVARLNSDGSLDTTFIPPSIPYNLVNSVAIQSDGKIVISGWFDKVGGTPRAGVARLNENGTLDASFDPGNGGGSVNNYAMVIDGLGRIIVSTQQPGHNSTSGLAPGRLVRFLPDGALDPTFSIDLDATCYSLALQKDGKILAAGLLPGQNNILCRVTAEGLIDETFAANVSNELVQNGRVYKIALDQQGRIIIVGGFSNYDATFVNQIARLHPDGSFDPGISFATAGEKGALAIDNKGRILMAPAGFRSSIYRLISDPQ